MAVYLAHSNLTRTAQMSEVSHYND